METAIFGLVGVFVGGFLQLLGQELLSWRARRLDVARIRLLKKMLADEAYPWRTVTTCSRVIGADEPTTIRLLVEAGARGSESNDGTWGLVSRHPFKGRSSPAAAPRH